jgi:hypothetical protein
MHAPNLDQARSYGLGVGFGLSLDIDWERGLERGEGLDGVVFHDKIKHALDKLQQDQVKKKRGRYEVVRV